MQATYSKTELMAFLETSIGKGRVNGNTGGGIRAACNKLLEKVEDGDDVRQLDVQELAVQYNNRHPNELSGDSLRVYVSRVRNIIDMFIRATDDPVNFKFNSKPAATSTASGRTRPKANTIAHHDPGIEAKASQERAGSTALLKHHFPLRQDLNVEIQLPRDLTAREAKRLSNFIDALASPEAGGDLA